MSRWKRPPRDATRVSPENADRVADVMKAVAHPLRLRIIDLLCGADERVSDIARKLGAKQALVSQQLRILRMSGLVETYRAGGVSRYTLAEPRLGELIDCVAGCKR